MRTEPEASMSVTEVAKRLRRTPGQVLDLIDDGELAFAPTTDINAIRVPDSALEEYLSHYESSRIDSVRDP
jgi:excisionase family DNA binding protein